MLRSFYLIILLLGLCATVGPVHAGARQERAKVALVEWRDCVTSSASRFAQQPEPAETLATAAMASCFMRGQNFRHLLKEATREYGLPFASTADAETLSKKSEEIEAKIRDMAVLEIIQARAGQR